MSQNTTPTAERRAIVGVSPYNAIPVGLPRFMQPTAASRSARDASLHGSPRAKDSPSAASYVPRPAPQFGSDAKGAVAYTPPRKGTTPRQSPKAIAALRESEAALCRVLAAVAAEQQEEQAAAAAVTLEPSVATAEPPNSPKRRPSLQDVTSTLHNSPISPGRRPSRSSDAKENAKGTENLFFSLSPPGKALKQSPLVLEQALNAGLSRLESPRVSEAGIGGRLSEVSLAMEAGPRADAEASLTFDSAVPVVPSIFSPESVASLDSMLRDSLSPQMAEAPLERKEMAEAPPEAQPEPELKAEAEMVEMDIEEEQEGLEAEGVEAEHCAAAPVEAPPSPIAPETLIARAAAGRAHAALAAARAAVASMLHDESEENNDEVEEAEAEGGVSSGAPAPAMTRTGTDFTLEEFEARKRLKRRETAPPATRPPVPTMNRPPPRQQPAGTEATITMAATEAVAHSPPPAAGGTAGAESLTSPETPQWLRAAEVTLANTPLPLRPPAFDADERVDDDADEGVDEGESDTERRRDSTASMARSGSRRLSRMGDSSSCMSPSGLLGSPYVAPAEAAARAPPSAGASASPRCASLASALTTALMTAATAATVGLALLGVYALARGAAVAVSGGPTASNDGWVSLAEDELSAAPLTSALVAPPALDLVPAAAAVAEARLRPTSPDVTSPSGLGMELMVVDAPPMISLPTITVHLAAAPTVSFPSEIGAYPLKGLRLPQPVLAPHPPETASEAAGPLQPSPAHLALIPTAYHAAAAAELLMPEPPPRAPRASTLGTALAMLLTAAATLGLLSVTTILNPLRMHSTLGEFVREVLGGEVAVHATALPKGPAANAGRARRGRNPTPPRFLSPEAGGLNYGAEVAYRIERSDSAEMGVRLTPVRRSKRASGITASGGNGKAAAKALLIEAAPGVRVEM